MKSRLFLLPLLGLIALVSTAAYTPIDNAEALATDTEPVVVTATASTPYPAPASAPATTLSARVVPPAIDTLPRGRHQVSSYRNGKSTEFVVEDGAIQSLKIDGKEIPASEFDEHQPLVERMLGTNKKSESRVFFFNGEKLEGDLRDLELDLEDTMLDLEGTTIEMEGLFENLGESFEGWGESFEILGEKLGHDFETIFEDGVRVFRFRGGTDGGVMMNLDSLRSNNLRFFTDSIQMDGNRIILRGNSRIIEDQDRAWIMERQRDRDNLSEEEQIREMETMIERLERKKAAMQRELEQASREGERAARETERAAREERIELEKVIELDARQKKGPDYEDIVKTLRSEGLIPDETVTRFKLDNDNLKINGKKMSAEAHARFMEIYKNRYGDTLGKQFKVEYKED